MVAIVKILALEEFLQLPDTKLAPKFIRHNL